MSKKKLTLAITAVVLVLTMAIGGTLAYFTDKTDTKTNTFTVGNVNIELTETEWNPSEGDNFKGNITPGNIIPKNPVVENTGANPAFVRMFVTITENAQMDAFFDAVKENPAFAKMTPAEIYAQFINIDLVNWTCSDVTEDTEDDTRTFEFRYNKVLFVDGKTEPLFTMISIPAALDKELDKLAEDFSLVIYADAIQADNFLDSANYTDAEAVAAASGSAFDALDASYIPAAPAVGE